jgi:4-hydroxybenzoate polyprenyltransferase
MAYSFEEKPAIFKWHRTGLKDHFMRKLHELLDFITFSSTILAITGGVGVYVSCFIQGIPCTAALVVIMTLVSFSVYNLNRKTDEQEDEINHKERFSFTKKFEKELYYGALAAYGIALGISALHGLMTFLVTLIPIVSGVLYSVPLLPEKWKYNRLKEIPLIKNVLVAGAWAMTLSLLPVYASSGIPGIITLLTGIFFFNYVFMASVLPDIRDREGDAFVGVTTIPVLIGMNRTKVLLVGMTLALGTLILYLAARSLVIPVILLLVIGISYIQFCILSMDRYIKTNIVCDILADGGFIFLGMITAMLILSGVIIHFF